MKCIKACGKRMAAAYMPKNTNYREGKNTLTAYLNNQQQIKAAGWLQKGK
ncbi:MAG: hypothetical protein MJB12_01120 [Firmicutes bacterium]|nr:hypothetical protein [Bacillota bacterium]